MPTTESARLGGGQKMTAFFFWVENHESFGVFFLGAKKVFPVRGSMGFVWSGVGRVQVMHFSAVFAVLAVLATSVTPCYPLRGV